MTNIFMISKLKCNIILCEKLGDFIMVTDAWITPENAAKMVASLRHIAARELKLISEKMEQASILLESNDEIDRSLSSSKTNVWERNFDSLYSVISPSITRYLSDDFFEVVKVYTKTSLQTAPDFFHGCVLIPKAIVQKSRIILGTPLDDMACLPGDDVEWVECGARYRGVIGVIEKGEAIVCDISVRSGKGDDRMKCVKVANLHKKYRCP